MGSVRNVCLLWSWIEPPNGESRPWNQGFGQIFPTSTDPSQMKMVRGNPLHELLHFRLVTFEIQLKLSLKTQSGSQLPGCYKAPCAKRFCSLVLMSNLLDECCWRGTRLPSHHHFGFGLRYQNVDFVTTCKSLSFPFWHSLHVLFILFVSTVSYTAHM